ncbi:hypothetical protein GCM10022297_02530 [Lactobacillus hamsteri]|nr:SLAP domain-containing protein [Lactobacillus hamsteri]
MKKTKIIGLTAAALLAVAPIASTSIVSAADATQTGNTVTQNTNTNPISDFPIAIQFTQDGKTQSINPDGMYFQVSPNSSFNPTEFTGSNGNQFKIVAANNQKVTVDSNTVDTSKAGSVGTVKLTVGTDTVTYKIFVAPTGQKTLNIAPRQWIKALGDSNIFFSQGQKIYVGNNTQIINGISYSPISSVSQEEANSKAKGWLVETKYLANETPAPETVEKTVMHKALVYDDVGGSKVRHIAAFTTVTVDQEIKTIQGTRYYKISDRPDYLKVSNIDGTKRTLTKNAYIYATSKRRADRTVLKKGETITTYGGSYKFKNGKRYYRIEGATATNKRYVKVANFE